MTISKIVRHFDALGSVPVDLPDVIAQFEALILDERLEVHGIDQDYKQVRGFHYRYEVPAHPDSALMPEKVVKVVYSTRQEHEWQRLVCCKELVHVFDRDPMMTTARKEVVKLGNHLAGGQPIEKVTDENMQAFFDQLAKYQALAILFPFSIHEQLKGVPKTTEMITAIAEQVELPTPFIWMTMNDKWAELIDLVMVAG